jgi:small subunit ribosomal protein S17
MVWLGTTRRVDPHYEQDSGTKTMSKRTEVGVVTSDRMTGTRRVEIPRLVKHPKYGKFLRRRTICYVHDEKNESHMGDTVEIVECRPMSRLKRWALVRVLSKGKLAGVTGRRAAARETAEEKSPV